MYGRPGMVPYGRYQGNSTTDSQHTRSVCNAVVAGRRLSAGINVKPHATAFINSFYSHT